LAATSTPPTLPRTPCPPTPGYFFFFIGSAFLFAHSTVTYHWEKEAQGVWWLKPVVNSPPFWFLKVFITKQCLDFLASAFLILTWRECVQAWASVYYLPLIWMVRRGGGGGGAARAAARGASAQG
jgi:hypothetical protein